MVKAFDISDLVARLKAKGVADDEKVAMDIVDSVFGWTADSLSLTTDPYLRILGPVLVVVKPEILKLVDQIDGDVVSAPQA